MRFFCCVLFLGWGVNSNHWISVCCDATNNKFDLNKLVLTPLISDPNYSCFSPAYGCKFILDFAALFMMWRLVYRLGF